MRLTQQAILLYCYSLSLLQSGSTEIVLFLSTTQSIRKGTRRESCHLVIRECLLGRTHWLLAVCFRPSSDKSVNLLSPLLVQVRETLDHQAQFDLPLQRMCFFLLLAPSNRNASSWHAWLCCPNDTPFSSRTCTWPWHHRQDHVCWLASSDSARHAKALTSCFCPTLQDAKIHLNHHQTIQILSDFDYRFDFAFNQALTFKNNTKLNQI